MKIFSEKSLTNFEFWSGASINAEKLTTAEMYAIEDIIEDLFPEGIDETRLNDIFWFDFDMVVDWLGYTIDEYGQIIR